MPELRAFAFVREVLVGEEGDEDGDEEVGYEERVRYGHDGVQLELFDDEDEIDDEIDTVLKNLSVDEEEMSNRASTSDEDDDDDDEEEEGSEDEESDVIEKKHVTANRENAKPFSLRVRLASSGGVGYVSTPNVFENSIFNVTSSYSNDEENKKKYKKSRNANRIGKGVDDAITFKFWANPSSLAEALSSPDALLKVHTSSSVSSVSMSGLLQKPTVKESLVIREEQEKVRLELTLSDLSSSFSSPHFVEEDEEQENFEPKPRPPLAAPRTRNRQIFTTAFAERERIFFFNNNNIRTSNIGSRSRRSSSYNNRRCLRIASHPKTTFETLRNTTRFRARELEARTHACLGEQVHRGSYQTHAIARGSLEATRNSKEQRIRTLVSSCERRGKQIERTHTNVGKSGTGSRSSGRNY